MQDSFIQYTAFFSIILMVTFFLILLGILYIGSCLRSKKNKWYNFLSKIPRNSCKTLVIIGSGGHTTEMSGLLRGINFKRYKPIHLVIADTDFVSLPKLKRCYPKLVEHSIVHKIRRTREVEQSKLSAIETTFYALLDAIKLIFTVRPDLIITNGPGNCLPISFAGILSRFFLISDPFIVYIESFCRVKTLSLSGKFLYYLADRFIVQWPKLREMYPRAEYFGILI